MLDGAQVHGDVPEVARQTRAGAVGGQLELLGESRAVEDQPVLTRPSLNGIAAVTVVPDERVVTLAQGSEVGSLVAVHGVVACSTGQSVAAVAAADAVVAVPTVDVEGDERSQVARRQERVVAAVGVQDQPLAGADIQAEGQRGNSVEAHSGAVRRSREGLADPATVHHDRVGSGAALVEVAAVAGVPDHLVLTGAAERPVRPDATGQRVVAAPAFENVVPAGAEQSVVSRAAEHLVVPGCAEELVVTRSADEECPRQGSVRLVDRDAVISIASDHHDRADVRHRGPSTIDPHRPAVDLDVAAEVAAHPGGATRRVDEDAQDAVALAEVRTGRRRGRWC